jgi:isoleucyl-tRNA synthetase
MSFEYEARIVETFYEFFEQGFVYKGLKPVFWCIHDQTALAEAEVEYETNTSPSVYVRYRLTSDAAALDETLAGREVYTVIWTTTPWTLPASQAVAFNPDLEYVAISTGHSEPVYLVAAALREEVEKRCGLATAAEPLARFNGSRLDRATFQHPFLDRSILGVNAPYVTADQGTGAVHTAPAHGVDDFYTGKRYNLPELQYVDNAGRQKNTGGKPYEDLTVFQSNKVITEFLREHGALLNASEFEHSYPHCWRCHKPVIVRATEQWFIGMETPIALPEGGETTFRQAALDAIKTVVWDPAWGEERISNMIATRPDWCISRQRIWGVPIAVFLCNRCHQPLVDPAVNKRIVKLFQRESADAWYVKTPAELLPAGTSCAGCGNADKSEFRKEIDILDVWFESGASWHAVLEQEPGQRFPADLYTEGGDQHRGWFHSSLLNAVALRGVAPYRKVATSGWTLDEQGRAFSKSLGNGVDPVDIAKRLGAEIVRLWVASVDFREDVAASENLMQRVSDNYRKLRNTLRFLLGNLHDFVPARDAVAFTALEPLDQYILARTAELDAKIRKAYDDFEFHRAYHALNEYVNTDLSALYLDVLKDRLYTFAPNAPARRSAQTALWRIAEALTRLIAPILSFTADEVWSYLPPVVGREPSVHLALFPDLADIVPGSEATLVKDWEQLLEVRDFALKQLENARNQKLIGKGLEAMVSVSVNKSNPNYELFERYDTNVLAELFGVSQVTVSLSNWPSEEAGPELATVQVGPLQAVAGILKCERCWRYVQEVGQDARFPTVCLRCAEALEAIGFPPYEPGEST